MKSTYYTTAAFATLFAMGLLSLQIIGGIEYTAGSSLYTQASMIVAMGTVAALPVFLHLAWRINRAMSLVLFVGFLAFLGYSLPANIGRVGEVKEVKVVAAIDAADLKSKIAAVDRTLTFAEPDALRECAGAPSPLPPQGWPECRRKMGTVDALKAQRGRHSADLTSVGSDRVGDVGSETLAWALSFASISSASIRKSSGMALAVGLEVCIFALVWLAASAVSLATRSNHARLKPSATDDAATVSEPPPPPGGRKVTARPLSDSEALADIRREVGAGNRRGVVKYGVRWGVSKSEASKRISSLETAGEIACQRTGREKLVIGIRRKLTAA